MSDKYYFSPSEPTGNCVNTAVNEENNNTKATRRNDKFITPWQQC